MVQRKAELIEAGCDVSLHVGGLSSLVPLPTLPSFPQITESEDYSRKQWGSRHVDILSPSNSVPGGPELHSHRGQLILLLLYGFAWRANGLE